MYPFFLIGPLTLPSYGVFLVLAVCLSCTLAVFRFKALRGDPNQMIIIAAVTVGFGLFGGHLLYLASSYGLSRVWAEIQGGSFSFLQSGGLVFYGALLGGGVGFFLSAGFLREKIAPLLRAVIPCVPLGHAIGRVGCLFSGCCHGLPYSGVCALHLEGADGSFSVFPLQAVESLANLLLFSLLLRWDRRGVSARRLLSLYSIGYSAIRFVLEFFRGDLIRGIVFGLSTSQWISLALFLFGWTVLFTSRSSPPCRAEHNPTEP